MQRVTITLDDDLMGELDRLIAARGYGSRSEAIRDLARAGISQALLDMDDAPDCIAALVYVTEQAPSDLAQRLAALFRAHHDLSVATMHVHLNHSGGLEVALLKGPTGQVRALADKVLVERDVRHGRLHIVPARLDAEAHSHTEGIPHGHLRAR